jgi:hypothetical protein
MYLVLNRDEVLSELAKRMLAQHLKKIEPKWSNTTDYISKCHKRWTKSGLIDIDFNTVNAQLRKDLEAYKDVIVTRYKQQYRPLIAWLDQNYDRLGIDRQRLIDAYVASGTKNFVKNLGQQLTDQPVWTIAGAPVPDDRPVIIRNIINNEALLGHRLANSLPFWFIDSGYTNFLTGKKLWHRLVQDHLHTNTPNGYFPADRLGLLPSMPVSWQREGSRIVVVCASQNHHQVQGTDLISWRENVELELRRHTDRPVEWRHKEQSRKTRTSVFEDLQNDKDVYCVISDSSAAAIEAIWLGIPVITLGRHISSAVARNDLSQINDLYRGPIGDWLCALTYSQFTQQEMYDGTALKLIKEYHV